MSKLILVVDDDARIRMNLSILSKRNNLGNVLIPKDINELESALQSLIEFKKNIDNLEIAFMIDHNLMYAFSKHEGIEINGEQMVKFIKEHFQKEGIEISDKCFYGISDNYENQMHYIEETHYISKANGTGPLVEFFSNFLNEDSGENKENTKLQ